ncbi:MAG TPA: hypothetical protein VF384_18135 [Planctomycetota bacterium]
MTMTDPWQTFGATITTGLGRGKLSGAVNSPFLGPRRRRAGNAGKLRADKPIDSRSHERAIVA